jgi:hypothetical protein
MLLALLNLAVRPVGIRDQRRPCCLDRAGRECRVHDPGDCRPYQESQPEPKPDWHLTEILGL